MTQRKRRSDSALLNDPAYHSTAAVSWHVDYGEVDADMPHMVYADLHISDCARTIRLDLTSAPCGDRHRGGVPDLEEQRKALRHAIRKVGRLEEQVRKCREALERAERDLFEADVDAVLAEDLPPGYVAVVFPIQHVNRYTFRYPDGHLCSRVYATPKQARDFAWKAHNDYAAPDEAPK